MQYQSRSGVLEAAREAASLVRSILAGKRAAHELAAQNTALLLFDALAPPPPEASTLHLAALDCLVDILSCDDARWDTPVPAFQADLHRLETLLADLGEPDPSGSNRPRDSAGEAK